MSHRPFHDGFTKALQGFYQLSTAEAGSMSERKLPNNTPSVAVYQGIWWTEADGVVASELNGLRLAVRFSDEGDGKAQFRVLRPSGKEWTLAGLGNAPDAVSAMRSASRMAECLGPNSLRLERTGQEPRQAC
jgi:hypothetical protein